MHPEQQNSFLSIYGKESKTKITMDQIMASFFFLFFRKNECLSSIPWIQEQLIAAHQLALTLLMQNCPPCLNGSSCTIPLPPGGVQICPWTPACTDSLHPSMGKLLYGPCSSMLYAPTTFKTTLDTIGKVLGTPASSRPGKPCR